MTTLTLNSATARLRFEAEKARIFRQTAGKRREDVFAEQRSFRRTQWFCCTRFSDWFEYTAPDVPHVLTDEEIATVRDALAADVAADALDEFFAWWVTRPAYEEAVRRENYSRNRR